MKKKLLSALLSVAMVATLLVGCGGTTTEEAPATDAATEEPATDAETTTDTNTNTAVDGDDEEPGNVDTGVAGFASILGVVALAGVVASKKR